MNISKDVLDKIKTEDIKPKSRWSFLVKNYMFWVAGFLAVAVGSIAVSVIIFVINNQEWSLAGRAGGFLYVLVYVLPYFWLVVFALFILVAYYNIRHIDGGYKYQLGVIIAIYFLLSILFGSIFYAVGLGEKTDRMLSRRSPFYGHFAEMPNKVWHKPGAGMMVGKIMNLDDNKETFNFLDINNKDWVVDCRHAKKPPMFILGQGQIVSVVGRSVDDNHFVAEEVMPFKGSGCPLQDSCRLQKR